MKLAQLNIANGNQPIRPVQPNQVDTNSAVRHGKKATGPGRSFSDVLDKSLEKLENLKFSAHAASRMLSRNIQPSESDLQRLTEGVEKARENGSNSSLILVDDMAYVVSVKNQTVITALNKDAAQGNLFSNIDSVAIV